MIALSDILNDYITNDLPFAFVRLPKKNTIYLIKDDKKGENIYSFTSFNNLKKYSFHFSDFIQLTELEAEINFKFPLSIKENPTAISKSDYLKLLQKTILFLQEEKAEKIVISREKWIDYSTINPIESFLFLCKKYPNSFCHLSYWNSQEIWMGATPEVLGSWDNSQFITMSLAGTLPDEDTKHWEKKEIEEQKYVTDYVYKKIKKYSSYISIKGPETLHLGHIKHLVTHFTAQLKTSNLLSELIQSLHPTPAVCGIPLETSRSFILTEEEYERDFYAGYISLETPDFKNYFVNLRCAKIYTNGALLFVGGGITAQSNPEKEWEETELKAKFVGESL